MTIKGAEGMSPDNIRDEINRGGRLVIYMYCVSILVMTFKRPSDIRLVKAGHNTAAAGWPYVLLTLLFQGSTAMTERVSSGRYPAYAEYQRRTSRLIPMPPRG